MSSNIILIIGPSGVGKGTMITLLKQRHPEFYYPISATTRERREGEKEGETYVFLSKADFEKKITKGEFLEYAQVHNGNYYGTLKEPIMNALSQGKTVVREIDYQGFLSVKKIISPDILRSLFILPPSRDVLYKRIHARAPISDAEFNARMESLEKEVAISQDCTLALELVDGNIEASYQKFKKALLELSL